MPTVAPDIDCAIDPAVFAGLEPGARVVTAMSGGVDSSVVAALLKHRGYDVVGITLQLYDNGAATGRKGACCAGRDIEDAKRVADRLDIPHFVFDYESRFRKSVIDPFAASYLAGETPVPCITCNQTVKFRDLLDTARELGGRAMATGHYAQVRHTDAGPELFRGVDAARDQSYFLFATTRDQLSRLRFPLGGLTKAAVRELAARFALPVADKPDSQDICFVPSGRYSDVIERLKPTATLSGDIVHVDGRKLGEHAGIINFTVGQRRGLGVPTGEPLYVVRIDAATRQVTVGPRACLFTRNIVLRDVNWLGTRSHLVGQPWEQRMFVRVRSTQAPQAAIVGSDGRDVSVILQDGDYGISAGQACVFYADESSGSRVLGGGFIASTSYAASSVSGSQVSADEIEHVRRTAAAK